MAALKIWDGATWQTVAHGAAGNALPAGGATNMLLAKQSAADADAVWTTAPIVGSISIGTISTTATFAEGANIATGATTGTKIGTAATQKLGFWNATPVTQNTGWSITGGYAADKSMNPESTTLTEVARLLGTLVDALKACGILGA
jgi:hypothetical protein